MDALNDRWTSSPAIGEVLWTPVEDAGVAARLRRRAAELAQRLWLPPDRVARIQIAVSEAASNLCKHARQGEMMLRIARRGAEAVALEMVCVDLGPGMDDVPDMMRDGRSSTGTLGVGLGAIRRIADHCDIYSLPSRGTVLAARFDAVPAIPDDVPDVPARTRWAGLTRPITGQEQCGDAFAVRSSAGVVYAVLCDGLGHGPPAARASEAAVRAVRDLALPARPADLVERVHRELASTRGGAVAVAAIDPGKGRVDFAGLGNVAGWILGDERRQGMISVPGIAGHQSRGLRQHTYHLPPGGTVVLHSDGLTGRWNATDFPGLLGHDPLVVAAALLRDAGVRRDDKAVVVVRTPARA